MRRRSPRGGDFDAAKFVASDVGADLLRQSSALSEVISSFCAAERNRDKRPQDVLRGHRSVGIGGKSEVYEVSGIAVKVCTPTTGRYYWRTGDTTIENLIGQFKFLTVAGQYLEQSDPGHGITVPEQLFAVRTHRGSYIRAEQLMRGWRSLRSLAKERGLDEVQEHTTNEQIKGRIIDGVGGFALKFGLMDLGLGRDEYLHSSNVLVPEDADQLAADRLCIIDQPSNGLRGRVASMLAGRYLSGQAIEYPDMSHGVEVPTY